MSERPLLSILIPTLDEESWIGHSVRSARASLRATGLTGEIVVCDGDSADRTVERARRAGADRIVCLDTAGRSAQLNRAAEQAEGRLLALLHADTIVRPEWVESIAEAHAAGSRGGWFQVEIIPERQTVTGVNALGWMAAGINGRTRLFRTATADQGLWTTRELFERIGGMPDLPIMEGNVFAARVRERVPISIGGPWMRISGRRWERGGLLRTMLVMYLVRAGFLAGLEPSLLRRFWQTMTRR